MPPGLLNAGLIGKSTTMGGVKFQFMDKQKMIQFMGGLKMDDKI